MSSDAITVTAAIDPMIFKLTGLLYAVSFCTKNPPIFLRLSLTQLIINRTVTGRSRGVLKQGYGGTVETGLARLHLFGQKSVKTLKTAKIKRFSPFSGATGRTRTGDLLITNQLLYQLSHSSRLRRSLA